MSDVQPPVSVALVSFSGYPDQGATYFFEMARSLARCGHSVTAIAVRRPDEPMEAVEDGVRVLRLDMPLSMNWASPSRWAAKLSFLKMAARYLRQHPQDIVHVYCTIGSFLVPVLTGATPTRWVHEYQTGAVSSRTRFGRWLEDRVRAVQSRFFDANFVVTSTLGARLFGKRSRRFQVVPAGVNLRVFNTHVQSTLRTQLGIPPDAVVFVHAGVLESQRSTEVPLLAFVKASRDDHRLWLLMPGKGSQLEDLRRLAESHGVSDRVWLPGYVPYTTIPQVFAAANAGLSYLTPRDYYDGQPPMKVMEYMASGLPVLANDVPSHRLLIRDGENGMLAPSGAAQFAELMLRFSADRQLQLKLSTAAAASLEHLTYDRVAADLVVPAYRRLVAAR